MHPRIASLVSLSLGVLLCVPASSVAAGDPVLADAAKAGDAAAVRALLESHHADVNGRQPDGATALHWAAHWDDIDTAALLIRAGADVNAANDYGVTPLMLACTNGSAAMAEALLNAGANVRAVPASGEPPILTAALAGRTALVKVLLTHGADVNATEPSGQTALMWAAAKGHGDVVRLLIARGATVTARSASGFSSLLFAGRRGDIDVTQVLLEAGADVNETATDGSTALLVATVAGHTSLAKFLLDRGADPNLDKAGYTPLHWVVHRMESELAGPFGILDDAGEWAAVAGLQQEGRRELLKALLAHGANPNARLTEPSGRANARGATPMPYFGFRSSGVPGELKLHGGTPFLLAAQSGDVANMRVLLASGADPHLTTTDGNTPLMVAAGYGRIIGQSSVTESEALEAVKLALETGGDVNASNELGETALHGAAYQGWNSVAQLLVDRGAKINATNTRGETPLFIAEGNVYHSGGYTPHPATAELLRSLGGISLGDKPHR